MILRMLKEINEMDDTYQNQTFASVLKRLNWQGLLRDSSVRLLKEQHGEVQWKQPLYYNRKMIILGEAMVFNETGKSGSIPK